MKRTKNFLFAILALASFAFTSCDKDVETSPVSVDLSQKATITGYVYADLNLSEAGYETVAANTPVIVSIPYSNFKSGATGNWVDTVKTDANGIFTVTVPTTTNVSAAGVTVTITTTDFTYDQVQSDVAHYTTIKKIFSGAAQSTFTILPSESKIKQYTYGAGVALSDFENLVTIKGKAYANLDESSFGSENAPAVEVTFYCDGWSKKVTLVKGTNSTNFTVDVPLGKTISIAYDFTNDKKVADGLNWKTVTYRYHGTITTLSSYSVDTEGLSIDFGEGAAN